MEETIAILEALAQGIDPTTGEIFPKDSPYQQTEIVRALFNALEVLKKSKPMKAIPINQGGKWTNELNNLVVGQFNNKMSISEIAKSHGRSYGAIKSKLEKLNLIVIS